VRSHRNAAWAALTILIVVLTYVWQLRTPLELQDDHRIIAPVITPHPHGVLGAWWVWVDTVHLDVVDAGRFRPVSQVFDAVGPLALGPDPLVWHIVLLAIAATVTLLLYYAGSTLWMSPAAGVVFALVTMLAPDPGPTTAWYRLGPKEGWEMVLLAGALAVMVFQAGKDDRRLEWSSFVLVMLAAYSKEPFVLLVPALFGVRVWLEARARQDGIGRTARRLWRVALAYAGVFAFGIAGILYVVRSAGTRSYGAQSLKLSLAEIGRIFLSDVFRAPSLAIWFVPPILAALVLLRRGEIRRPDLLGVVLFLAWVVPQYAIYATRGGFWDHYWLPCVVAFAAADAAAITFLIREPRSLAFMLAVVAGLAWTANAIRIDALAVRNFSERARVQQGAVDVAVKNLTPASTLVLVGDYSVESERAGAFVDFVRYRGGRYRRALMFDSACTERCGFRDFANNEFVSSIDPGDVGVVAFLDHKPPKRPLGSWFAPENMRRVTVTADQLYLSLRKRAIVRETFSLDVAVRNQKS